VNALLNEMADEGRAVLSASGVPEQAVSYRRTADLRYVGQGHEVSVPLPDGRLSAESLPAIGQTFDEVYQRLYGRRGPDVPLEVINWRLVATGPRPTVQPRLGDHHTASRKAPPRQAYFPELGGYAETPVYDRYALSPGDTLTGPAIVEERESTLVIGPRGCARIDDQLNVIVDLTTDD
jgi:N-methylhydantoinase A